MFVAAPSVDYYYDGNVLVDAKQKEIDKLKAEVDVLKRQIELAQQVAPY